MKKPPKPKPRKAKRRRPNPGRGTRPQIEKFMENYEDAALGGMLGRVLGSLLFPMLCPGFGRKVFDSLKPGSTLKIVEVECVCGGTCVCHTGLQMGIIYMSTHSPFLHKSFMEPHFVLDYTDVVK